MNPVDVQVVDAVPHDGSGVDGAPVPPRRSTGRTVSIVLVSILTALTLAVVGFVVLLAPAASAAGGCGG
jgi:hypothetical protein